MNRMTRGSAHMRPKWARCTSSRRSSWSRSVARTSMPASLDWTHAPRPRRHDALQLRAAPARAARRRLGALCDARPAAPRPWDRHADLADRLVRTRLRPDARRPRLATRHLGRGRALLDAHGAARDPRRPRAALLPGGSHRPDPAPRPRAHRGRAAPHPRPPASRPPAVGAHPLRVAPAAALRRGDPPRCGARARAHVLLRRRDDHVDARRSRSSPRPPGSGRAPSSATSSRCA